MREHEAESLVRAYAADWGVPVRRVRVLRKYRAWWYFGNRGYEMAIDADDGTATAWVFDGGVCRFDYRPTGPKTFLLPLWAAFPTYNSVTMGWRQGEGEDYKYRWHAWYRSLTDAERAAYRDRCPAPIDAGRAWAGWYEEVADRPATGEHPIGELILGRV
jgi:hypothetical protein